ncbi:MAG: cytochrome c3 family protein, partial [Verrucomicrobiota bacterium]
MPRLIKAVPPLLYVAITATLALVLFNLFFKAEDKSLLLPGETTHGHYQIELQCDACHTDEKRENVFTSSGVPNSACTACHGEDLTKFSDSHPVRKFRNPENAIFLEHIDAMSCVACHTEHNQKVTNEMAVTVPNDYCAHCHEVTLENLESHKDLTYDSCATAGCHNYHDNIALAPSFLLKHFGEPEIMPEPQTPQTDALARWFEEGNKEREALKAGDHDGPPDSDPETVRRWAESAHAMAGINCSSCHDSGSSWIDVPEWDSCNSCHGFESESFLKGKHGMRLAHKSLSPMTPAMARQPMKADAAHR